MIDNPPPERGSGVTPRRNGRSLGWPGLTPPVARSFFNLTVDSYSQLQYSSDTRRWANGSLCFLNESDSIAGYRTRMSERSADSPVVPTD